MSMILQICGTAVTAAVCAMILKKMRPGPTVAVSVAALILIFLLAVNKYGSAVLTVSALIKKNGFEKYGELMLKALGIGITVKIASDICRDCGEESIAGGGELAGKLEILLLCIPFAVELLTLSSELVS